MKRVYVSLLLALSIAVNIRYTVNAEEINKTSSVGIWEFIESIPLEPIYPTIEYVEVEPKLPQVREVDISNHSGMKTWMPYTLFGKSSNQYRLQQYAVTDSDGFRSLNGRYMVAVGTAVNADVGQYLDIELANGEIIPAIVSDIKADRDTKSDNLTTAASGCVCEFIVDKKVLNQDIKYQGDTSAYDITWDSPIVKFIVYEKLNFLGEE